MIRNDNRYRDITLPIQPNPYRNIELQETHDHLDAKIFLRCSCGLIVGENDPDRIIAICEKKKEGLRSEKLHEQVLTK